MESLTTIYGQQAMTSLQIAELTGKSHAHIMRDIRNMEPAWEKISESKFGLSSYQQSQPNGGYKEVPCYLLTKTECLYIATKFNDEARAKLVLRWQELEMQAAQEIQSKVPKTFAAALLLAAEQQEQIEAQQKLLIAQTEQIADLNAANAEMRVKVSYYDQILASKSTVTTTQIAADYGMSAKAFNKQLHEMKIQRKVSGQWILYTPYNTMGYTHSETFVPESSTTGKVIMCTRWTQKGRLFLYDKLKRAGIIPMIER